MADALNTYQPEVEDANHTSEMLNKADELQRINASDEDRPDWLPPKFKSTEEMARAYSELERRMGSSDDEEYDPEDGDYELDQDFVENEATANDADGFLGDIGLEYNAFVEDYIANDGALSDEAYAALNEAGIGRDLVDSFINGQEAVLDDMRQTAFDSVGGRETYEDMVSWASDTLSSREVAAFNRALETDMDTALWAIQGLHSQYRSDVGQEPNFISGEVSNSAGAYQSVAELTAAMSDPRYDSDPAYRQSVAAKLTRSSIL